MKYLLDTHALLWYLLGDSSISTVAKSLINSEDCYYSYCSLWEIAIKQSLGKLKIHESIPFLIERCYDEDFIHLPILGEHIERVKFLPFIHHDPFDRLLIAQAQTECMTIITKDHIIPQYDVKTAW